jgi:hypothetical protein
MVPEKEQPQAYLWNFLSVWMHSAWLMYFFVVVLNFSSFSVKLAFSWSLSVYLESWGRLRVNSTFFNWNSRMVCCPVGAGVKYLVEIHVRCYFVSLRPHGRVPCAYGTYTLLLAALWQLTLLYILSLSLFLILLHPAMRCCSYIFPLPARGWADADCHLCINSCHLPLRWYTCFMLRSQEFPTRTATTIVNW